MNEELEDTLSKEVSLIMDEVKAFVHYIKDIVNNVDCLEEYEKEILIKKLDKVEK